MKRPVLLCLFVFEVVVAAFNSPFSLRLFHDHPAIPGSHTSVLPVPLRIRGYETVFTYPIGISFVSEVSAGIPASTRYFRQLQEVSLYAISRAEHKREYDSGKSHQRESEKKRNTAKRKSIDIRHTNR